MSSSTVAKALLVPLITVALVACGAAEAVVTAEIELEDPAGEGTVNRALDDLEIVLLPYDRDQVFDSLTRAAATPEPEIPQELMEAQAAVAAAQQRWRDSETRWNTLRDTLQTLTDAMQGLSRGEARYVALFREWQDMDRDYQRVERQMNSAFDSFNELQSGIIEQIEQVRIMRDNWADEAFVDVMTVIETKIQVSGLEALTDTTDAQGLVTFQADPGSYWLHARHEMPYSEFYWNVPITLARGEPVQVRLSNDNADERPIF